MLVHLVDQLEQLCTRYNLLGHIAYFNLLFVNKCCHDDPHPDSAVHT